ncbi:hypothetical protein ACFX10_017869 [Malus domestica]
MDRCVARLQELQYTVSGGTKVISGVSLSPGSSRGYLRASLRCKQETARIKGSAPRKSHVGKFPAKAGEPPSLPLSKRKSRRPATSYAVRHCKSVWKLDSKVIFFTFWMCKVWIVHITGPNLYQNCGFLNRKGEINTIAVYAEGACEDNTLIGAMSGCLGLGGDMDLWKRCWGPVTGIQDLEQKWLTMQESKASVKFALKMTGEGYA